MYSFGLCEVDEVSLSIATNHQLSTFFVKKLSLFSSQVISPLL